MMRGMGNMQGMMKQMQKLQKEMESAQEYLNALTFEGVSSQEFVKVTMNGKREVLGVSINKDVVDPEDVDMLEDLIVMAMQQALEQVDKRTQEVMGKYTKGLPF